MLNTEDIKAFCNFHAVVLKKQTEHLIEEYFVEIGGHHYTFIERVNATDKWFVHPYLKPRYNEKWNCVEQHRGLPDAFHGRRDVVLNKRRLLEDCWNKWHKQLRREFSKVKKDLKNS